MKRFIHSSKMCWYRTYINLELRQQVLNMHEFVLATAFRGNVCHKSEYKIFFVQKGLNIKYMYYKVSLYTRWNTYLLLCLVLSSYECLPVQKVFSIFNFKWSHCETQLSFVIETIIKRNIWCLYLYVHTNTYKKNKYI